MTDVLPITRITSHVLKALKVQRQIGLLIQHVSNTHPTEGQTHAEGTRLMLNPSRGVEGLEENHKMHAARS